MNSINLLPKNIKENNYNQKNKKGIFLISFLMLAISSFCYAIVFTLNIGITKESEYSDVRLNELDVKISSEIEKNKSELIEDNIKNASILLDKHAYYSVALIRIQDILNKDIYLVSSDFSLDEANSKLNFTFQGFAKNTMTVLKQIAVFKGYYWIDDIEVSSIPVSDNEEVPFNGKLILKDDIILYHQKYWNHGLSILTLKTDRFLKINDFAADLVEENNGGKSIVAHFSGHSYNLERLKKFEEELKQTKPFVEDAQISYNAEHKDSLGFYEFNGTMKYFSYN